MMVLTENLQVPFRGRKRGTFNESRQSQDEDSMSETAENAGQRDDPCSDNDKINREFESSFQRKKKGSNVKKKGGTKKAEKEGSRKKSTEKNRKRKANANKSRSRKHCKTMDDVENRALPVMASCETGESGALPVKASCETGESGALPVKASCETGASSAKEVWTGESTTSVDSSVKQAVRLINQEQFIMKKVKHKPKKCAHCDKMVDDCKCPPSKLKQLKVCCYCSLRFLKCDTWYKHMNEKHGLQCPSCEFVHYR